MLSPKTIKGLHCILHKALTIEDIFPIMDRIVTFDKIINSIKEEEE